MALSRKKATIVAAMFGACGLSIVAAQHANAGECRDPWITRAITEVTGRAPNAYYEDGDCKYTNYNGGHWGSYGELKGYVQTRLGNSFAVQSGQRGLSLSSFNALPKRSVGGINYAYYNGQWLKIVAQGGGNYTLISNDGASIISTNGSGFR